MEAPHPSAHHSNRHEGKRDWFGLFSSFRHVSKHHEDSLSLSSTPSPDGGLQCLGNRGGDEKLEDIVENRNWTAIQPSGFRPQARRNHATTVIGRKMIVVGGETDNRKLNDVHMLHLGKLTWSELGSSVITKPSQQLPPCSGHSLIAWGKTVLLVGGDMDLDTDKVTVWSFDLETEHWTKVHAKGDVPAARSGQTVSRAGSILVMFGGQDARGRMLNDLHVLDLKSLIWLPLLTSGKGPSPRARHVAGMYDDRYLLVFGGSTKTKVSNDLYALDFETMVWSRLKPGGCSPSPRTGSSGVLVNNKWYITGGAQRGTRVAETIALDIPKMSWMNAMRSSLDSVASNQGLSLVVVQKKDRTFLVTFGGSGAKSRSNEVQVLYIASGEQREDNDIFHGSNGRTSPRDPLVPSAAHNAVSPTNQRPTVLSRLLDSPSPEAVPGLVPLRQIHSQAHQSYKAGEKVLNDNVSYGEEEPESPDAHDTVTKEPQSPRPVEQHETSVDADVKCDSDSQSDEIEDVGSEEILKEKLALAVKKNLLTEAELEAVQQEKDELEKKLNLATRSQQSAEAKLGLVTREVEGLRRKLEASELVQEESNSLSNIVHSENLRLEHDLSFLKAVLEETQKELHSTRGVLASERTRAFQLQVELFELKQTLQS
ncbi:hypothetical protein SELMODRAFT_417505 [Selaginella moellendorffii]|uniref:Acyl-CoA-binding domain-containing protein n=1 Tax=Selaginella moellendorffii TaxID=88036 RepID=D8S2F9_SELML|nr:acyl-CoA-binding domain-containing protein 4 [Selaginella moellendorffii]EFJ21456.1 hypothetical protein SELMODRAFT_417505 [Selaginella moellendorffii]|eukprot:XP_002977452.1 acyl-CoA-binding domain-containing protein 4 [Selaginella moellendorffii]